MGGVMLAVVAFALVSFMSAPQSMAAVGQLETLEVEVQDGNGVTTVTELQEDENTIIIENGSAKILSYGVGSRKF